MQRRAFLAGTAAAVALPAVMPAAADELPLGNLPNWRYPDPRVEVLDKRFKYKIGNGAIERIATGFRWAEGPAYHRGGGFHMERHPQQPADALAGGGRTCRVFRCRQLLERQHLDREGRKSAASTITAGDAPA